MKRTISLNALVSIYCFGIVINLFVLIFQSAYFGTDGIHNYIWYSQDLPGIGIKNPPQAFGNHYFGDFLHVLIAGDRKLGDTPYFPYLPASILFGKFFSFFSYRFAVSLYFLIFIPILYVMIILLKKNLEKYDTVNLILPLVFNTGLLYLIDRGNIQLIVSAGISLFLYFLYLKKPILSGLALGIAISIKFWPIIFLIPLLRKENRKLINAAIISFFLLNVLALLIFDINSKGWIAYLHSQFSQIIQFGSINSGLWHAGGKNSSLAAFFNLIGHFDLLRDPIAFLLANYFAIQIVGAILLLLMLHRHPMLISESMLLCGVYILIFPSAQYGYSLSILIPLIIFNLLETCLPKAGLKSHRIGLHLLFALIAIMPISFVLPLNQSSQWLVDVNTVLTPLSLLFCGFTLSLMVIKRDKAKK